MIKARIKATGEIVNIESWTELITDKYDSFEDPIKVNIDDVEFIPEQQTVSIEEYNKLKQQLEYKRKDFVQIMTTLESAYDLIKQLKGDK